MDVKKTSLVCNNICLPRKSDTAQREIFAGRGNAFRLFRRYFISRKRITWHSDHTSTVGTNIDNRLCFYYLWYKSSLGTRLYHLSDPVRYNINVKTDLDILQVLGFTEQLLHNYMCRVVLKSSWLVPVRFASVCHYVFYATTQAKAEACINLMPSPRMCTRARKSDPFR